MFSISGAFYLVIIMKSLAYSLVFPTPNKQNATTTSYLIRNHLAKKDNELPADALLRPKLENQNASPLFLENTKPKLVGRREVITSGASIGILASILFPSQFAEASCEFTSSPSGLAFCDQIVGTGPQASNGQLIKAHYTGKLENGKIFDSSYNRGKPLTFRVGVREKLAMVRAQKCETSAPKGSNPTSWISTVFGEEQL